MSFRSCLGFCGEKKWLNALAIALGLAFLGAPVQGTASLANLQKLQKSLEANIQAQLGSKISADKNEFIVDLTNLSFTPALQDLKGFRNAYILGLGSEGSTRLSGLISVPVVIEYENQKIVQTQMSAVLDVMGPVYTLTKIIPRGQVIAEKDIKKVSMPWKLLPAGSTGVSLDQIVGQRAKTTLNMGSVIYSALLEDSPMVKNGEIVELTIHSGQGVMIRSRGVAKQEGRVGDAIRIEQPDTKKMLSGVITDRKAVEVRL